MNKKKFLKVLAVPVIATSFVFTSVGLEGDTTGVVHAAVNKETQANNYANETFKFLNEVDKRLDLLPDEPTEKQIKDFINYLEKNYKDKDYIKGKYGNDLSQIHGYLDNYISGIYEIYDFALNYDEDEELSPEEVIEAIEFEAIQNGEKYGEKLADYVNKNKINANQNLKTLVEDFGGELKTTTSTQKTTVTHTVKKGDTLNSIAKKYNTTVKEIKTLNKLKSDLIKVGQKLKVEEKKVTTPSTPTTPTTSGKTYTVKKNDTLYSVAKKNNMTVKELKTLNNLKSDVIVVGQKLKLKEEKVTTPKPTTTITTHTVKKGDTLYSISKKYKISVNDLKKLNNLKSDKIVVGKKLKVKK